MEEGLAKLAGSVDGGKLAPVSELSLDAAAALSRSSSKAASLGRYGLSVCSLSCFAGWIAGCGGCAVTLVFSRRPCWAGAACLPATIVLPELLCYNQTALIA